MEIWMFWRYSTHILGNLHMMNIQLRQLYQIVFCCACHGSDTFPKMSNWL